MSGENDPEAFDQVKFRFYIHSAKISENILDMTSADAPVNHPAEALEEALLFLTQVQSSVINMLIAARQFDNNGTFSVEQVRNILGRAAAVEGVSVIIDGEEPS